MTWKVYNADQHPTFYTNLKQKIYIYRYVRSLSTNSKPLLFNLDSTGTTGYKDVWVLIDTLEFLCTRNKVWCYYLWNPAKWSYQRLASSYPAMITEYCGRFSQTLLCYECYHFGLMGWTEAATSDCSRVNIFINYSYFMGL